MEELDQKIICSLLLKKALKFEDLVIEYRQSRDKNGNSCLSQLIESQTLFLLLFEQNSLSQENLKCLWSAIDNRFEMFRLVENTPILSHLTTMGIVSFSELVDRCATSGCLSELLKNNYVFRHWIKKQQLTTGQLPRPEGRSLSRNTKALVD